MLEKSKILEISLYFIIGLLFVCLYSCGTQYTVTNNSYGVNTAQTDSNNVLQTSTEPTPIYSLNSSVIISGVTKTPAIGWQANWLKGVPCQPPCWEGVTPGKTTLLQAFDILRQNLFVTHANTYFANKTDKYDLYNFVDWDWTTSKLRVTEKEPPSGGVVFTYKDSSDQTIFTINPKIPSVKLGDVIAAYGEPSHIVATTSYYHHDGGKTYYHLFIVYLERGLVLSSVALSDVPVLQKDLILKNINFFTPTLEQFMKLGVFYQGWTVITTKNISVWEGFKDFSYYCKHTEGNSCSAN